ncbi:MAG: 30S ribosomal protein S12 methylthiotransferase RimO [Oscillospiraceae bacterium]|nr:30S ribosomal protein S12 methylthiotransferase RimO [Oscillospiraceae bacterium]
MLPKIGMVSLGCAKNQVDAERMLYNIDKAGYKLCSDAALADIVIINTCGFIESAKEEAIETILEFAQLKKEGRIKRIIVTGCLAQRYKGELEKEIPEADAVVGIGSNGRITEIIEEVTQGHHVCSYDSKMLLPLTGGRIKTTLPYYSYLKIAEGCSNCCAFCAIPMIRGKYRSVPMEALLEEAQTLADGGVKELVVIAQDSTRYGTDIYGREALPELLEKLCAIEGLKWIRVLYLYPEHITDEILDVIAREDKIVKYIEMPIQHSDDKVLAAMGRKTTGAALKALVEKIRTRIPGVTLRTTVMTGFPGEGEEEFEHLADFVKEMKFDRLGCFAFSPEEGTLAAKMEDSTPKEEKEHRADIIMEQQMLIAAEKNEKLIDKDIEVLTEGFDRYGECYFGRSAADAPDIDGKVFFTSPDRKLTPGMFVTVHVTEVMDYDLIGEYKDESSK